MMRRVVILVLTAPLILGGCKSRGPAGPVVQKGGPLLEELAKKVGAAETAAHKAQESMMLLEQARRAGDNAGADRALAEIHQQTSQARQAALDAANVGRAVTDPQLSDEVSRALERSGRAERAALSVRLPARTEAGIDHIVRSSKMLTGGLTLEEESRLRRFLKDAVCTHLRATKENRPVSDEEYGALILKHALLRGGLGNNFSEVVKSVKELAQSVSQDAAWGKLAFDVAVDGYCGLMP